MRVAALTAVVIALAVVLTGPAWGLSEPFTNCTEAHAAGASNIPSSDPRYRTALDRDRDGVACESDEKAGPPRAAEPKATRAPAPTVQRGGPVVTH